MPGFTESLSSPEDSQFSLFALSHQSGEIFDIESEERRNYAGFTLAELIGLGALGCSDESDVKRNNLEGQIHPAFVLENWDAQYPNNFFRKELYPIEGSDGYWTAHNQKVWRVLEPSLRLASKFLDNAHLIPWYDAFIFGDRQEAYEDGIGPHQIFRRRPFHQLDSIESTSAMRNILRLIAKGLRIGICAPGIYPVTNGPTGNQFDGFTIHPSADELKISRIYLSYDILIPLMEPDLGPSTRLAIEFNVASTLLHEFAHVVQYYFHKDDEVLMYFENEVLAEVGSSFEVATFGGTTKLILQPNVPDYYGGRYRAGLLVEEWLGTRRLDQFPITTNESSKWRLYRACPLYYLEELGQEDFWRLFVPKWGAAAFKPYPISEGRSVRYDGASHDIAAIIPASTENPQWLLDALRVSATDPPADDTDEDRVLRIALRRISEAKRIEKALAAHRNERQLWSPRETLRRMGPGDLRRPGTIRLRDIELERNELKRDIVKAGADETDIEAFLERTDYGSDDYLEREYQLRHTNEHACKRFEDLIKHTWDDGTRIISQGLLIRYQMMRESMGFVSRGSSLALDELERDRADCKDLMAEALSLFNKAKFPESTVNIDIFDNQDVGYEIVRGTAHLLIGMAVPENNELKIWHLEEAVAVISRLDEEETARGTSSALTKERRAIANYMLSTVKKSLMANRNSHSKTSGNQSLRLMAGPNYDNTTNATKLPIHDITSAASDVSNASDVSYALETSETSDASDHNIRKFRARKPKINKSRMTRPAAGRTVGTAKGFNRKMTRAPRTKAGGPKNVAQFADQQPVKQRPTPKQEQGRLTRATTRAWVRKHNAVEKVDID